MPSGGNVRPTTDRVREAIFSSLGHGIEGTRVLDLFAGSGALGFEALSRGADFVTFVEKDSRALKTLAENARTLKVSRDRYRIVRGDVLRSLKKASLEEQVDWAFMDPPYEKGLIEPTLKMLVDGNWVRSGGGIIVDHSKRDAIPEGEGWSLEDRRVYGDVAVAWIGLGGEEGA